MKRKIFLYTQRSSDVCMCVCAVTQIFWQPVFAKRQLQRTVTHTESRTFFSSSGSLYVSLSRMCHIELLSVIYSLFLLHSSFCRLVCYALTYNNVLPTVKQNDGIGLKQFFSNAATLQALQYSKLNRRIDMFWHEETSKSYTYSIQSI